MSESEEGAFTGGAEDDWVSPLDAAVGKAIDAKADDQKTAQCRAWIEAVVGETLDAPKLADALRDGQVTREKRRVERAKERALGSPPPSVSLLSPVQSQLPRGARARVLAAGDEKQRRHPPWDFARSRRRDLFSPPRRVLRGRWSPPSMCMHCRWPPPGALPADQRDPAGRDPEDLGVEDGVPPAQQHHALPARRQGERTVWGGGGWRYRPHARRGLLDTHTGAGPHTWRHED
jgi:hypothetical protein